jgi:hypothetical protein
MTVALRLLVVVAAALAAGAAAKNVTFWRCTGNHCGEGCAKEEFAVGTCLPNGKYSTFVHLSTVPQRFVELVTFQNGTCDAPLFKTYQACNKITPTPAGTFTYISGCASATMTSPAVLHEGCDATGQGCTSTLPMKAMTCLTGGARAAMAVAFPVIAESLDVASYPAPNCTATTAHTTIPCGACSAGFAGQSSYYAC